MRFASNVPDDWGSYYRTCGICNRRYHASEGGCDCTDDLECACGSRDWAYDNWAEELTCRQCGSGPAVETFSRTRVHVARKAHKGNNGEIRVGDRYKRTVYGGHFPNGPRWMCVAKNRVEKGPAWDN